ncbi:MAG: hypothetical protein V1899_09060 [Planctomycetota bacterium]
MSDRDFIQHNDAIPSADIGPILSAWLDDELPVDERAAVQARMENDALLKTEMEEFRQVDVELRDWYSTLLAEAEPRQKTTAVSRIALVAARPTDGDRRPINSIRRLAFYMSGLAAAIVAVVVLIPWMQGKQALILAEEAIAKTAKTVAEAEGMLATFTTNVTRRLTKPDAQGNSEETRTAAGEIRFGRLIAKRLLFRCAEVWAATGDESELCRDWGQTINGQWSREKQEGSETSQETMSTFDPDANWFAEDRASGSPTDVRTRRAVEGLAALVRSFSSDLFLRWMGCRWKLEGGSGKAGDPWVYKTEPFAEEKNAEGVKKAEETIRERIIWTMHVAASKDGVIDDIELEESIFEGKTGALVSLFRTAYRLKLCSEQWPLETFRSGGKIVDWLEKKEN